jgi:hypothetical protein
MKNKGKEVMMTATYLKYQTLQSSEWRMDMRRWSSKVNEEPVWSNENDANPKE